MLPFYWIAAANPHDAVAGLPAWVPDVLSVGGLITLIVGGLATSKLWTKSQVDGMRQELVKTHDREVQNLKERFDTEIKNLKERYETHLTRTVELYQGRIEDAIRREGEWRDTAVTWQKVAEMLAEGIEPMQEQSATMLAVLQTLQAEARRPGRR